MNLITDNTEETEDNTEETEDNTEERVDNIDDSNILEKSVCKGINILTNQKWKTYKLDITTKNLIENLEKTKVKHKKENFQKWLCMDIYPDVNTEDHIYLPVHRVLDELCTDVKSIIGAISNEKEFRDNVATMIYKESRYG